MCSELKLIISLNDKVVKTVTKEVCEPGYVNAIEDFQVIANTEMTKLIEDSGDSGDCLLEEDSDDSDNEGDISSVTPKKKKK